MPVEQDLLFASVQLWLSSVLTCSTSQVFLVCVPGNSSCCVLQLFSPVFSALFSAECFPEAKQQRTRHERHVLIWFRYPHHTAVLSPRPLTLLTLLSSSLALQICQTCSLQTCKKFSLLPQATDLLSVFSTFTRLFNVPDLSSQPQSSQVTTTV